jgi:hypothetical protein
VPALRAISNDTAPPIDDGPLFGPDEAFVTQEANQSATITGIDWGKPEAYGVDSIEPRLGHLHTRQRLVGQFYDLIFLKPAVNNSDRAELVAYIYKAVSDASTRIITVPHHATAEALSVPLPGYEKYQTPNWDQFDAEPITAETLAYARRLLRVMPTSLGSPDVASAADGSIALEWVPASTTHKLNKLFIDIGPGTEWRAYWKMRDGKFDRLTGVGFPATTKATFENLFAKLSG